MDWLYDFELSQVWFDTNIANNEFLWAAVAAGLLVVARNVPSKIWSYISKVFSFQVAVRNDNLAAFFGTKLWLMEIGFQRWTNRYLLQRQWHGDGDQRRRVWVLSPDDGTHFAFFSGIPLIISKETDNQAFNEVREKLSIRFITPFKKVLYSKVLSRIEELYDETNGNIRINTFNGYDMYEIERAPVPQEALIYPDNILEHTVADIRRFLDSRDAYAELGIHWHRGFGFFGPPGTGKTSFILALATHFELPVFRYNLRTTSASAIVKSIHNIERGFIVFEDADVIKQMQSRDYVPPVVEEDISRPLTKAGHSEPPGFGVGLDDVLSILDGLDTPEGAIFILTSNHPEVFDQALLRAGRVDIKIQFKLFSLPEVERMITKFFGHCPKLSGTIEISGADLQGYCRNNATIEQVLTSLAEKYNLSWEDGYAANLTTVQNRPGSEDGGEAPITLRNTAA